MFWKENIALARSTRSASQEKMRVTIHTAMALETSFVQDGREKIAHTERFRDLKDLSFNRQSTLSLAMNLAERW